MGNNYKVKDSDGGGDPYLAAINRKPRKNPSLLVAWLKAHVDHQGDECLIWPFGRDKNGYAKHGNGLLAHRTMCILAHGEPPTRAHQSAHKCGRGHFGCVHPGHLKWATPIENSADSIAHGTSKRGARNWETILTPEQVIEIRALKGKMTYREIGERYGIAHKSVYSVVNRRTWKWLQ